MKKTLFALGAATLLFALPALAANGDQSGQGSNVPFEQRKAQILQRIDERLAHMQQVRTCVAAATTPEALRACRGHRGGGAGQGGTQFQRQQ